jgi:LmbE family N-acetylglucosaminyl deacetylase
MHNLPLCGRGGALRNGVCTEASNQTALLANRESPAGNACRGDFFTKYVGETVLGVGAHPDDLELGVGGTLARLSQAGARVVMAVVSVPNNLEARLAEARRGAAVLGCECRILIPDRCTRVEDMKSHQLVSLLDGMVKELAPAALLTHCLANYHADHKMVFEACLATQRLAYFDMFCYSPTSCVPVNIAFQPQAYIDISDTIELKMRSIEVHRTQFSGRGLETGFYREAAHLTGRMVGLAYAEGLEIVRLKVDSAGKCP